MYDMELLERTMAIAMKKTTMLGSTSCNGERRYPPEAYQYDDDVTPEAIQALRAKVSKKMGADEWEVVDGFDIAVPA